MPLASWAASQAPDKHHHLLLTQQNQAKTIFTSPFDANRSQNDLSSVPKHQADGLLLCGVAHHTECCLALHAPAIEMLSATAASVARTETININYHEVKAIV